MKLKYSSLLLSLFALAGCQNMMKTMGTHIRIDNSQTAFVAKGNAFTNFCLSKNLINRATAYDFSLAASDYLDLVVFDNDIYKSTYDTTVQGVNAEYAANPASGAPNCSQLESKLPTITTDLRNAYAKFARELSVARTEDNYRWAQQMANFRLPATPMPQLQAPQVPFPNRSYSSTPSPTQNILIQTGSGIAQCRVTSNNFVFCI